MTTVQVWLKWVRNISGDWATISVTVNGLWTFYGSLPGKTDIRQIITGGYWVMPITRLLICRIIGHPKIPMPDIRNPVREPIRRQCRLFKDTGQDRKSTRLNSS